MLGYSMCVLMNNNEWINTKIPISKTSNDKFINPNKFGNSKIYTITREQI